MFPCRGSGTCWAAVGLREADDAATASGAKHALARGRSSPLAAVEARGGVPASPRARGGGALWPRESADVERTGRTWEDGERVQDAHEVDAAVAAAGKYMAVGKRCGCYCAGSWW